MKRIDSIDAFRGVIIFAMIFCASIGFDSNLPAWMFHCQCPPPDYLFHPEVRGITWVDLIFPFFIFTMGASIPFSLSAKLEKGTDTWKIVLEIIKRGVVLFLFSLVVGNGNSSFDAFEPFWLNGLFRFGLFVMMFVAFVKVPNYEWVNILGWGGMAALLIIQHFVLNVPVKFSNCDTILWLLSVVSVVTGLIWLFTRDSHRLRAAAWFLIIATKLFGMDFLQYSIIAVPATMIGDMILSRETPAEGVKSKPAVNRGWNSFIAGVLALAAIVLQLWALRNRFVLIDGLLTLTLAAGFLLLTFRSRNLFSNIGYAGFGFTLIGIVFDPLDGGIAKDYCNMSYLFVTLGCAILMLCLIIRWEASIRLSRTFIMAGRNPMVAYTMPWFMISPYLFVMGFQDWFDPICVGNPTLGVIRGIIISGITMALTCLCSWQKWYWKN